MAKILIVHFRDRFVDREEFIVTKITVSFLAVGLFLGSADGTDALA